MANVIFLIILYTAHCLGPELEGEVVGDC